MTERFSAETLADLREAGWSPSRRVPEAVAAWRQILEQRGLARIPAAAEAVLLEFGGLTIGRAGAGKGPACATITVDPSNAVRNAVFLNQLRLVENAVGETVYPVGFAFEPEGSVDVGESGRVYVIADVNGFIAGNTFDRALECILRGDDFLGEFLFRPRPVHGWSGKLNR